MILFYWTHMKNYMIMKETRSLRKYGFIHKI